jgi:hypothetical protein
MQVVCIKVVWILLFLGVPNPKADQVGAGQPPVGGVFGSAQSCEAFYLMASQHGATWPHTCLKMDVNP